MVNVDADDSGTSAVTEGGVENGGPSPASRSPAARRALAEAAARRAEREPFPNPSKELHGRGGLDPVRYGDWEVKGIASDF